MVHPDLRRCIAAIFAAILAATATLGARADTRATPRSIGFVGCSNTMGAVLGYFATPGQAEMWPSASPTNRQGGLDIGQGRIDLWTDPASPFWQRFDAMVRQYGRPRIVWVQLCEQYQMHHSSFTDVQALLGNLKKRLPEAVVYISAINVYEPRIGLCAFMGRQGEGEAETERWRDQAVAEGLARRGPELGPLTASTTGPGGCHPNPQGMALLGKQLHAFFDRL